MDNTNGDSTLGQEEENPWLEKPDGKPVDHFAADEAEILANRLERDDSDSEVDDQDLVFGDMQLFFHAIEEPQLIDLFLQNKVTLGQLMEMDEQDLVNCGVTLVGDRKKILANTAQMHCEKWMPSSFHDLTSKTLLSSPGIYIALNDINKHLEYIGVTLKYLRRQLKIKPEILELGKDYVGVGKVSSELEDLIKTSKSTHKQIQALDHQVGKFLGVPALKPANLIDDNYIRQAKIRKQVVPALLLSLGICISYKLSKFVF